MCKTGPVTWTWQCRMRVLENRVMKRIFPQNRKKATERWRKPHGEGPKKFSVLRKLLGLLMVRQEGRGKARGQVLQRVVRSGRSKVNTWTV